MKTSAILLTLSTVFTACGGQAELDVGDEPQELGLELSDYSAVWDGYAEAFTFAGDGTDRVRLTLDENGNGTIRFGEEALIPLATDPDELYPPLWSSTENFYDNVQTGFEYPLVGAVVTSSRLQFRFDTSMVQESWCALRDPDPVPGSQCGDAKGFRTDPTTGNRECYYNTPEGEVPYDCIVETHCTFCECDEVTCRAKHDWQAGPFDAALSNDGDSLEGTLIIGTRVTIRLTRQ